MLGCGSTLPPHSTRKFFRKPLQLGLLPLLLKLPVAGHPLPAAFAVGADGALTSFIEAPELDAADLNGLMQLVRQRL